MSSRDSVTGQGRLSSRLARLSPSATVGLGARVAALRAQGIDVISFAQGEPDFATPAALKAAGVAAIEHNLTKYTPVGGPIELRRAIARELEQQSGLRYSPDDVSATAGAKEALFLAFLALCDPGDEVIVPAPYWVSYVDQAQLAGATAVIVDTTAAGGFKMQPGQLRAALSPRTKAIVLNSPSNPTGATYSTDELRALADVLADSQAIVISDEIYDGIVYGEYARWLRVAPEHADRTLIVNGASKRFAMTGWRLGYIAGPHDIMQAIKGIQSHSTTHTASITQAAVLPAYDGSADIQAELAAMVAAFRERRDTIVELLRAIPGVTVTLPEGAFYVFPNIEGLLNRSFATGQRCQSDEELSSYLLETAHIGVAPGTAFGAPGFIRISYATGMAQIVEGMRRLAEAVRA